MPTRWSPHVTVAAIVGRVVDGRHEFLLVEEETPEGLMLNNPAGHLEIGESPERAVVREVREETARAFVPEALVGVYLSRLQRPATAEDVTYVRFAFVGAVGEPDPALALDAGIVRTLWLTVDELHASRDRHRSPHVLRCVLDAVAGKRHPLDAIVTDDTVTTPALGR